MDASLLYALSFAALIIIIITTSTRGESSLIALISGYSALLLSLMFLLFLTYNNTVQSSEHFSSINTIIPIVKTFFPGVLIVFVLSLLLAFLSIYFHRIATGKVPEYYYSFSTMSTILTVLQLGVWFHAMYKNEGKNVSDRVFSILTLIGTINALVVITLGIVLKYYSTDC